MAQSRSRAGLYQTTESPQVNAALRAFGYRNYYRERQIGLRLHIWEDAPGQYRERGRVARLRRRRPALKQGNRLTPAAGAPTSRDIGRVNVRPVPDRSTPAWRGSTIALICTRLPSPECRTENRPQARERRPIRWPKTSPKQEIYQKVRTDFLIFLPPVPLSYLLYPHGQFLLSCTPASVLSRCLHLRSSKAKEAVGVHLPLTP